MNKILSHSWIIWWEKGWKSLSFHNQILCIHLEHTSGILAFWLWETYTEWKEWGIDGCWETSRWHEILRLDSTPCLLGKCQCMSTYVCWAQKKG